MVKKEKSHEHEHLHEHKEHHENEEHHKARKSSTQKIRENPWIISTIILGILVILLLISNVGFSGKVMSEKAAGEALVGFLNQQTEGGVEFVSSDSLGSVYEITVSYQGQEIPVYVTKDGKYYVQGLVPIEEDDSNTNTNNQQQQVNVPKSDKPEVELFVMSYCPYGTQAEKGIIPAVEALGDKVDFKLRFVYYAMHPSQGEVEENLRQYCIQKDQSSKFLDYLTCFLDAGDNSTCLTEAKIDKTKLNSCMKTTDTQFDITKNKNDKSSWLSGYYPLFNIDKNLNEEYGVQGSPTLVINGVQVSSARDPASYLNVICQAFNNPPAECDTQLSTTAYGAGFGYETSGNSASAAQCA
jgi:protein-disulfide isomerase